MFSYIVQRLINALMVMFGVVTLVFMLIHIVPGDPVEVMLGEAARPADTEALRSALGLDKPIFVQWKDYITGVVQGDLGQSLHSQRPVFDLITERLPATAQLAIVSLLLAILMALPLGIFAALNKDTWIDNTSMSVAILGISMPNFWMGPVLILIFSIGLGWFPVSGDNGIASIVLPAFTLATALMAILSRMIRASMLEVLNENFIRAARARGLSEWHITVRHALRNAALPVITIIGMQLGALLGGAVITETVFSWPGIGQLTIDSIQRRDYPVVQACVLLISLTYVIVNLLTDLAYALFDPRVKLS